MNQAHHKMKGSYDEAFFVTFLTKRESERKGIYDS